MKAETKPFVFLKEVGKLVVPNFQRNYVWEKDNWDDLLKGFLAEDRTYDFLGSIILKETAKEDEKQLEIIDGQQRLTTLSILLKVLYDLLQDNLKNSYKSEIMNILYYNKFKPLTPILRLELANEDAYAYKNLMDGKINLNQINDKSHKILRCYKYFLDKLNKNTNEINKIKRLLDRLLDPNNNMFVVIKLDDKEDELRIFDTLNTTGVRLTLDDTMKNYLYKKVISLKEKEGINKEEAKKYAIKLYEETWGEMFEKDKEIYKYWKSEMGFSRKMSNNLEILLYSIAIIKNIYEPRKHYIGDISQLYKNHIDKFQNLKELGDFITEIMDYAKIYREKIIKIDYDTPISFEDYKKRLLYILWELKIGTYNPFILYVFKNYQDEEKIKALFEKLEKFIIKKAIITSRTKDYINFCKQFIEDTSNLDKKINERTWDKISDGLRNISGRVKKEVAKVLLFLIELYRRNKDESCPKKALAPDYWLELIMPETWKNYPSYWGLETVPHPSKDKLSKEQQEEDRNKKVKYIGNMILLLSEVKTTKKRGSLSFAEKMTSIKKWGTFFFTTKDDIVIPYENGDTIWDEAKIEARTEKLEKEIKEIWGE